MLEVIGLSFGLAVFVVKATGSVGVIDNQDEESRCNKELKGIGCGIYDWSFILNNHPMAVTVCALLLISVISRPKSWVVACPLSGFCSKRSLGFMSTLCLWFGEKQFGFDIIVYSVLVYSIWTLFAVVYVCVNHRAVRKAFACATGRLRSANRRRRAWLFGMGVVLIVLRHIFPAEGPSSVADCLIALAECLSLLTYAWIIFGMGLFNLRSSDYQLRHAPNVPDEAPRVVPVLLGWGCSKFLYDSQLSQFDVASASLRLSASGTLLQSVIRLGHLLGMLAVGTFLWGGVAGRKGVAY